MAQETSGCTTGCSPRVLSLNLASRTNENRIYGELLERTRTAPDILLLQEVAKVSGAKASVAENLAKILGYHAVFAAPKPGPTNIGLAIVSRWPLSDQSVRKVRSFYRVLRFRPRIALAATAHAPSGPIRIWTTHLDTRINVKERLEQLKPLLAEAAAFEGPCILGGDLNTNRARWLLHAVPLPAGAIHSRAVTDLMSQHGFHTPFAENQPTFDLFGLQLDWVYLRGLQSGRTGIEPLKFSDHHAIWTEFQLPGLCSPSPHSTAGQLNEFEVPPTMGLDGVQNNTGFSGLFPVRVGSGGSSGGIDASGTGGNSFHPF